MLNNKKTQQCTKFKNNQTTKVLNNPKCLKTKMLKCVTNLNWRRQMGENKFGKKNE